MPLPKICGKSGMPMNGNAARGACRLAGPASAVVLGVDVRLCLSRHEARARPGGRL